MIQRFKCSFCGKNQDQVERLIAGPSVYICAGCVNISEQILNSLENGESPSELSHQQISALLRNRGFRCSFCGKNQDQVKHLLAGPKVYICGECVNLCLEIIDEESGISPQQVQERVQKKVLALLEKTGAILKGHFLLSSGFHSEKYIQCAKALQYPRAMADLCGKLFQQLKFQVEFVNTVVGPALGAVTFAYEVARLYPNARALFTEREEGRMTLRRGFEIKKDENVLVVEDVLTTGGSVKEVMEVVREHGGNVVGVGAIVDRSDGKLDLGVPVHALLKISVEKYPPKNCPLCKQGLPLVKPGSRKV